MDKSNVMGVCGRVSAQILIKDSNGNIVPKDGTKYEVTNIVTNNGLAKLKPAQNNILGFSTLTSRIQLGTGTQAELESVTTLAVPAREVEGTTTALPTFTLDNYSEGRDLVVAEFVVTARFNPDGTARNYSEIGLGTKTSLETYTLFKNSETGEAETISVLGDEYLDLSYFYQVQGFKLGGFSFNQNTQVFPLADRSKNQPLGPFPIAGVGVPVGTEAYVVLNPSGSSLSSAKTYFSVVYFDAVNSLWDPSILIDESIQVTATRTAATMDYMGIFTDWIDTWSTFALRFPENRRPKAKGVSVSLAGGNVIAAPGSISKTDTPIYVVGYSGAYIGGLVMFTKPIAVTKDTRVEFPVNISSMWESKAVVNSDFVNNPEG